MMLFRKPIDASTRVRSADSCGMLKRPATPCVPLLNMVKSDTELSMSASTNSSAESSTIPLRDSRYRIFALRVGVPRG